jgi:hypothetical protein
MFARPVDSAIGSRRCSTTERSSAASTCRPASGDPYTEDVVEGGCDLVAPAPVERIPIWVRRGSIVVTYPAEHVAAGLGDLPEGERPLEVTLWGRPRLGRTVTRLADGTSIAWSRGRWSISPPRQALLRERGR